MYKRINVRNSTTCLVVENDAGPGSSVIGYNCSTVPENQDNTLWLYDNTSKRLKTKYRGREICMGVRESDMIEGGDVIVWDCIDKEDQKWELRRDGTIRNNNSLFCLSLDSNQRAIQRDCKSSTKFTW
jgi:hypothetical protein